MLYFFSFQIAGVTTVADASGFGFKQFRNFTLENARNSAKFIQVEILQKCSSPLLSRSDLLPLSLKTEEESLLSSFLTSKSITRHFGLFLRLAAIPLYS
jgi:hypothetical protein